MNGTEAVTTSSATSYYKEMQTISFSALSTGEVVTVAASPPSTGSSKPSSSTPRQPGTGTVAAKRVTVVKPTFMGRVQSKGNGTLTIVGAGGQLRTIDISGSTRYYKGTSKASSSAVGVGTRIVAEGTRDSITRLSADVISVAPSPPSPPSPVTPPKATPPTSSSHS
ncbi:MAG: hypothetical protein ACYDH5_12455 [Acidimicrobiales bacterium]